MCAESSSPFYSVYIIDALSGVELISYEYAQTQTVIDINAISGLLNALEMFINNLAYCSQYERVQDINFQGTRIVYEHYTISSHGVLCVGISNKQDPAPLEHFLLKEIVMEFASCYRRQLVNFRGNVQPFRAFTRRLSAFPFEELSSLIQSPLSSEIIPITPLTPQTT
jgi:hypothetical protein